MPKWKRGVLRTYRWATESLQICDVLAILPFYLELFMNPPGSESGAGADSGGGAAADDAATAADDDGGGGGAASSLVALRMLRLVRVTRIFKLGKQAEAFKMFVRVLANSMPAMRVLAFFVLIMMIFYGALIFAAEKGEWTVDADHPAGAFLRPTPDHFGVEVSPFRSIPFSFWWVLVTTTTTGYGDFFPTTVMGKTVGVCAMITGILMLALPITVIGANFAHEYEKDRKLKEQFKAEVVLRKQKKEEEKKRRSVQMSGLFHKYDADGSGGIDVEELASIFRDVREKISADELDDLMAEFGSEAADGEVGELSCDFDGFGRMVVALQRRGKLTGAKSGPSGGAASPSRRPSLKEAIKARVSSKTKKKKNTQIFATGDSAQATPVMRRKDTVIGLGLRAKTDYAYGGDGNSPGLKYAQAPNRQSPRQAATPHK